MEKASGSLPRNGDPEGKTFWLPKPRAFKIFGGNLRDLLLASPAGRRPVLGVDPGFRTGCKTAAVDGTGRFLEYRTIYPHEPHKKIREAKDDLLEMISRHKIELVAIGNGTAGRETEFFVREAVAALPQAERPACVMVSEAGASVYSASETAAREFPDHDLTVRGAISIARRLQDPLAELVKIDPKSIGVGQYQHDVDQAKLKEALEEIVSSCVNLVGVDANLASEELLTYVSGFNRKIAASFVKTRDKNGPFASRKAFKSVPSLGEKTFEQAAGFLRLPGGENPLDNSAVHPERYALVGEIARAAGSRRFRADRKLRTPPQARQDGLRLRGCRPSDRRGYFHRARKARPGPPFGFPVCGIFRDR